MTNIGFVLVPRKLFHGAWPCWKPAAGVPGTGFCCALTACWNTSTWPAMSWFSAVEIGVGCGESAGPGTAANVGKMGHAPTQRPGCADFLSSMILRARIPFATWSSLLSTLDGLTSTDAM